MAEMSPAAALRQLKAAQAGLKKVRQLMTQARANRPMLPAVIDAGWESLRAAHRAMAEIPRPAIDEAVLTQQLALERYATSLLVRLRRLNRQHAGGSAREGDLEHLEEDDIDAD
jgi:hypothetical protein